MCQKAFLKAEAMLISLNQKFESELPSIGLEIHWCDLYTWTQMKDYKDNVATLDKVKSMKKLILEWHL